MKWSWKLTRVAGIDIYVHTTFFILIAWIAMSYWRLEQNMTDVINGVAFILALFACIVLHEFGHALTARRYGIKTKHITLLPIGGVAALEKMPEDPIQEMKVALAGPLVSFAISLVLWLWLSISGVLFSSVQIDMFEGSFIARLMIVNLIIAVFNLLPAFPMDGGRVFRAALSLRMDRNKATQIAAKGGQILAFLFGYLGLLYNPFLLFIAMFVWIGATAEAGIEQIKSTLSGLTVKQAMLDDFKVLSPEDKLSRVIQLTLAGSQKDFPVMHNGSITGVLTQSDLIKGLQATGEHAQVANWMNTNIQLASPDEPLEKVMRRIQSGHSRLLSVMHKEKLIGIIDLDNIMEMIKIQTALHESA